MTRKQGPILTREIQKADDKKKLHERNDNVQSTSCTWRHSDTDGNDDVNDLEFRRNGNCDADGEASIDKDMGIFETQRNSKSQQ